MTSRWRSRLKSLSPRSVSSALTCWLTAPGVTNSSSAARVKLLLRAVASNALTALSGADVSASRASLIDFLNPPREMMRCGIACNRHISPTSGLVAAARLRNKTLRPSAAQVPPRDEERPMSDRSVSISSPSPAPGRTAPPPVTARTKMLLEDPILPTLLRLAAPNILTLLAFAGVITFDGFFLGRIGTNALAGASPAFPWVMMVLQTTNSGMGAGVSSAVARALGAGLRDRADALVFHAFLLALVVAAIYSTVLLLS